MQVLHREDASVRFYIRLKKMSMYILPEGGCTATTMTANNIIFRSQIFTTLVYLMRGSDFPKPQSLNIDGLDQVRPFVHALNHLLIVT